MISKPYKAHIAIVEDDPDVRDSLRAVVSAMGHDCLTFASAELFLDYPAFASCICILVDYDLPGMNGIELLSLLQQSGKTPPACLYTAQYNIQLKQASGALANTQVMEKGNAPDSIADYIRRVIPA